eukprot:2348101-Amphidinium_carterae.1
MPFDRIIVACSSQALVQHLEPVGMPWKYGRVAMAGTSVWGLGVHKSSSSCGKEHADLLKQLMTDFTLHMVWFVRKKTKDAGHVCA